MRAYSLLRVLLCFLRVLSFAFTFMTLNPAGVLLCFLRVLSFALTVVFSDIYDTESCWRRTTRAVTYTYVYVCMCMYIFIYIYIHTHTYTHTCIQI